MKKYKNAILLLVSIILLAYAGFISIFPMILTNTFNVDDFEKKIYDSTSLVTTIDLVEYKIKPNLNVVISLRNWSSKYIDDQPCFDASLIELTTTPRALFTKTFNVKNLYVKNAKYANQTLSNGQNKLAFIPEVLSAREFGGNKFTVIAGPVRVKNFKIKHIATGYYKEESKREANYDKEEVKDFLIKQNFKYIDIK